MRIANRTDLITCAEKAKQQIAASDCRIMVCSGTGCIASGSEKVYQKMLELAQHTPGVSVEFDSEAVHVGVKHSGCQGFCELGPLVRIEPQGYQYMKVSVDDCEEIFQKTVLDKQPIDRLFFEKDGKKCKTPEEIPFLAKQTRIALKNCGNIDAESLDEYMAVGGFEALAKALFDMKPQDVVNEVDASGLRGRGGGGFPAGRKWQQVARQAEPVKYVVCNGDEGDPGAFMDGSVMEGDPFKLIEGMMIGAYAVGAKDGYIYVRAEYPNSVRRLRHAISEMEERGLLGDNILGTDFSFRLHINRGAGAFVCGEGSALTASIEGKRGMPRTKPPRTVEQGLWGKPTVLNNVETFANVPMIIQNGKDWYRSIGSENSPGTKTFSLTGAIMHTGLIEVPMGTTLREVIFDIGGGIRGGKQFKAVQIGGPSGGCLTAKHLDLPLDFDSLKKVHAMIGSGGMVVMDETSCMVEVARFFMSFTQNESCGKCVPCREGTKRMLEILERIVRGKGKPEDIDLLLELANTISATALCGLGKSAGNPVVSTIQHFRDEYEAHVIDHVCPAKQCQKLKKYTIDPDKCRGCSKCARQCPAGAITGEIKKPFVIDQEKCIKCGACIQSCAFTAIRED